MPKSKKLKLFIQSIKDKIYSTIIIGHTLVINTVYAQELSGEDDTAIITALKWMLKVGGWISIVLFILGVLTYIGMDSGNSKNVIMTILTFVFAIVLVGWAIKFANGKMDEWGNVIFN
jgi:hypothetical protein